MMPWTLPKALRMPWVKLLLMQLLKLLMPLAKLQMLLARLLVKLLMPLVPLLTLPVLLQKTLPKAQSTKLQPLRKKLSNKLFRVL